MTTHSIYELAAWIGLIFVSGGFEYLAITNPKIISWTWASILIRKTILAAGIFILVINHVPLATVLNYIIAPMAVLAFIRLLILLTKIDGDNRSAELLTHDSEEILKR